MTEVKIDEADFWKWFDDNMIYCGETCSFVHRLADRFSFKDYRMAQEMAFQVIAEMKEEYIASKYEKVLEESK